MKNKCVCILLCLFCFLSIINVSAQGKETTSRGGADLVDRWERIAADLERLATRLSNEKMAKKVAEQDFYRLQDQIANFQIDWRYFESNGGTLSDTHSKRIVSASQRIEKASGQIVRNIERLSD